MTLQKALWLPKIGDEFRLGTNEIPEPGPGEVLVKLEASGLNPFDWKIQKEGFFQIKEYPVIIGEDGAGVVEKVGGGVTSLVKGDKVFFRSGPFDNKSTTFQEYCLTPATLASRIPDNISFDQAASICVALSPFAVATYAEQPQGLGYTPPFEGGRGKYAGQPIVIMGGASSLGQYAIQLAKLSGFSPIITTASLSNTELLVSLGATHVLDRKLSTTALKEQIANFASTPVPYIFDAVSFADTQQAAYDILAPGGTLGVVTRPLVKEVEGSGKTVFMVVGSFQHPPNRGHWAKFAVELTKWLADGTIKTNHVEVLPGGLKGIAPGLKLLESGISAKKLIVHPLETTA